MNARTIVAALSGALFAVGLVLSGMTQPSKVLGFLSVSGRWDPSLAFVMGGAIAVMAPIVAWTRRRGRPVFDATLHEPATRPIDARLIGGSVLFGVGWGMGGLCPGPALLSIATGAPSVLAFVIAMLFGIWAVDGLAPAKTAVSGSRID
jgi:uncharacterized membrane protein YedE/YeeE